MLDRPRGPFNPSEGRRPTCAHGRDWESRPGRCRPWEPPASGDDDAPSGPRDVGPAIRQRTVRPFRSRCRDVELIGDLRAFQSLSSRLRPAPFPRATPPDRRRRTVLTSRADPEKLTTPEKDRSPGANGAFRPDRWPGADKRKAAGGGESPVAGDGIGPERPVPMNRDQPQGEPTDAFFRGPGLCPRENNPQADAGALAKRPANDLPQRPGAPSVNRPRNPHRPPRLPPTSPSRPPPRPLAPPGTGPSPNAESFTDPDCN